MASFTRTIFCLFLTVFLAVAVNSCSATEFQVGGDFGWQPPSSNNTDVYSQWATNNRFHVGDSLSFKYKNDSVLEVDKWGYYHCNTTNPIIAFDNGKSIMKLDKPGPFYFISGVLYHCKNGQRLLVEVIHPHPISQSPPSIADPPETYTAVSPAPSPSSGASISVAPFSFVMALVATILGLVCCAPWSSRFRISN